MRDTTKVFNWNVNGLEDMDTAKASKYYWEM